MTRYAYVFAVAAALGPLAGCGGERQPAAATPDPAGESSIVRRAQITLEDLPAGWQASDDPDDSASKCDGVRGPLAAAGTTGHSRTFHHRDSNPSAESTVYLYADAANARRAFAELTAPGTVACLAGELAAHLDTSVEKAAAKVSVGEPSTSTFAVEEPFGAERQGWRVTLPMTVDGDDVAVAGDLVFLRVGRAIAALVLGDVGAVFDEELRAELTYRTAQRLDKLLE